MSQDNEIPQVPEEPKFNEVQPEEQMEQAVDPIPFFDFSKATIRFKIPESIRPKNPKTTKRKPLLFPLYSKRIILKEYENFMSMLTESYFENLYNNVQPSEFEQRGYDITIASGNHPRGDAMDYALTRTGSEWTNTPVDKSGITHITGKIPDAPQYDTEAGDLSGSAAIYFAIRGTQSGSPALMPLWHSGIVLRQNPPSNERVALMHERIAKDKIAGGRNTGGYIFSATSIITLKHAVELALETVYESNLPDGNVAKMLDIIPVTDTPSLLLSTLTSMYPYGYPYTQSCFQNPDSCNYSVTDTVSFPKMIQVDNSSITNKMRELMSDAPMMTAEVLEQYRNELPKCKTSTLDIANNGNVILTLSVPSISRSIKYGERWLNEIALDIKDVLSSRDLTLETRERLITERQYYSWMRQYEAWVSEMHVNVKGTMRAVARDEIPKVLAQLSRDADMRESYVEGIMKFIGDSTIALAAIPAWECPTCNTTTPEEIRDRKYYDLIPIDVAQVFFTLNSIEALMENMSEVI